jgi:fermentation-respiration switch protein FrsA (DUF1100 family)
MESPRKPRGRRLLRVLIILVVIVLLGLYIVMPAAFGFFATRPISAVVGAPPDGFENVTLTAHDGVELAAWYAPPENGAAILLVHGSGDSREGLRPYAELLAGAGFGVLAVDMRGHGESGGTSNRYGWGAVPDVATALDYLQAQPDVRAIGGLGLSLGAETVLAAAGANPAMRAVVSEGATFRSLEDYVSLPANQSLVRNFTSRVLFLAVQVFGGTPPPTPSVLDWVTAATTTDFLFIANGNDPDEVDFTALYAAAAGERAEAWVIPDAGHIQGLARHPDEYAQRVIVFFEDSLLAE